MNIGEGGRYKTLRQALNGAGLNVLNIAKLGKKTVMTVARADTGTLPTSKNRRLNAGKRLTDKDIL